MGARRGQLPGPSPLGRAEPPLSSLHDRSIHHRSTHEPNTPQVDGKAHKHAFTKTTTETRHAEVFHRTMCPRALLPCLHHRGKEARLPPSTP